MKIHGKMTFRRVLFGGLPMLLLLGLAVTGCKDEFEEYYERPGWLEKPAVSVLKSRGDCQTYLSLVEKTLFSKQLEGSGSYTFFVPTDKAFAEFFADNPYGYKSVDDIPVSVASDMVSFLMLYNQYPADSLGNTLEGYNTWNRGMAYKHQTPSYEVLTRAEYKGDSIWVLNDVGSNWVENWHNYRYLPAFSNLYLQSSSLSATADYGHFFPASAWSPYGNVLEARILDTGDGSGDLFCENGVVHLIDKVVMPLLNFDEMVDQYPKMKAGELPAEAQDGAWGILKNIVNHRLGDGNYQLLTFYESTVGTHYYEDVYPDYDLSTFKLRTYAEFPRLNYNGYLGLVEGDNSYNSGYTLFLPTSEVLSDYVGERVLQYVEHNGWDESQEGFDAAFNRLSSEVLVTLYHALFANGIVWPTQFPYAQNLVSSNDRTKEYFSGGAGAAGLAFDETTIKSSAFAGNGLYHITRFMPRTSAFEGVGSRFLLDPAYGYMEQLYRVKLATSVYNHMLFSKLCGEGNVNYNVILNDNELMSQWAGAHYDAVDDRFNNGNGEDISGGVNTMGLMGYVERDTIDALDFEVDPLDGAYDGWGFANTANGNIIRYKKSGRTVEGKPEIMLQSFWSLQNDPAEQYCTTTNGVVAYDNLPADHMPQAVVPTAGTYAAVIKDPTFDGYVNGNAYVATSQSAPIYFANAFTAGGHSFTGGSTLSLYNTVELYLKSDSLQEGGPRHAIFKAWWEKAKGASAAPAIGSGFFTVLIPTDEALQAAIDERIVCPLDSIKRGVVSNWADTAAAYVNPYIIRTDALPDDGASTLYSSMLWASPNTVIDMGSTGYPVSTNYAPMSDNWEDLMSGTTRMSGYVNKVPGTGRDKNRLQFMGRDYLMGSQRAVAAVNASEIFEGRFTNTVVRELGQSNVLGQNGVIHSFDGFIVYKVLDNPAK